MTPSGESNKINTAVRDEHGRWVKGFSGGPGRPLGSRNKLSEDFLRDWQEDWKQHGEEIFEIMREKFPEIYFQCMVKFALVHRIEQGQPQEFDDRPRPREQALEMLEQRAGPKARKMFERFLARIDKLERSEEEVGTA
jgi:hypothetical protein